MIPSDFDKTSIRHYTWKEIAKRYKPLVMPYKWKICYAASLIVLAGLAVALAPLFPKYIIDTAIPKKSIKLAVYAGIVFLIVQFIRIGLWYVAMKTSNYVTQTLVFKLRADAFRHLQHLSLSFHNKYPTGFLYERVFGSSIGVVANLVQTMMQSLSLNVTGLFFSMIVCFYFSWTLSLIILLGASGYVFAARKLSPAIYRQQKIATQETIKVTQLIMDRLHGHKTIQAYSMENQVQKDFDVKVWNAQMRWLDSFLETIRFNFVTEGIGYWLTALVVVGGAWQILYNGEQIGTLVAFIGYQTTLISTINGLTMIYSQLTTARVAFDQLYTIMDTHSEIQEHEELQFIPPPYETLSFENVSFGYTPDKIVLHDASFELKGNETVALVGKSGCGKTTVTNLMMRFYDPLKGTVRLNGNDIRELPLHEYRALFGVVLQDPYLFDTTIRENLRLVNTEATDEDMITALKNAAAWEFVKDLPGQLDYEVGEGGRNFSGGQRQRLAIARCLMLKSRFVVLDEATSALDPESESLIQQGFEALGRERAVLIIAHRLNTIRNADRILVMDQGHVVESGTYTELVAKEDGIFHRLNEIATNGMVREERLKQAGFA